LLVEGADDQGICVALLRAMKHEHVHVQSKDGYENLRPVIAAEIKGPGRTHLGIVVDADDNPAGRWASLRDVLTPLGYVLPAAPEPAGTVVEGNNLPRLGLWLMPDNVSPGMVEDFISALIPAADDLMSRAVTAVEEIPAEQRKFKPTYLRKAEVHTWLAWQAEPGKPMGQAITKAYLDGAAIAAAPFRAWLQHLFG
jgi:hypothetical protein